MRKANETTRKYIERCWREVFWTETCRQKYDRKLRTLHADREYQKGLPAGKMLRLCMYGQILMVSDTVGFFAEKIRKKDKKS